MGKILADGPKLFRIPPDIIDDLNAVDIPLVVDDYCQPFPAVVVQSGDEYHYVWHEHGKGLICATVEPGSTFDWFVLGTPEVTIEDALTRSASVRHRHFGDHSILIPTAEDYCSPHRFRGTLNFLLLVTAGGFVQDKQPTGRKKVTGPARYTIPTTFQPQDIALVRNRLTEATKAPEGEHKGHKRPHWRRAHWRRVAVGAGRSGREVRLIAACLINKKLLTADPSESEYVMG